MDMTVRALDAISVPAFIISPDHKVVAWNSACSLLTGVSADSMVGTDRQWTPFYPHRRPLLADLVLDKATDELATHYGQHGRAKFAFDAFTAEGWFDDLNGKRRYLVFEARPLIADGVVTGALEMLQDITEHKEASESLKLAARVFENTGEGIMVTDAANRIVSINKAFSAITGYGDEVIGTDPKILASDRHSNDFYTEMWEDLKQHGSWQGEIWNLRKDGSEYLVRMHISVIVSDDRGSNYVAVFSDITRHKEAEERITFMAHHDFLTGLPNRILLEDRLSQLGARSTGMARDSPSRSSTSTSSSWSTMPSATTSATSCSRRWRPACAGRCAPADTVSRQGGDEFVLLLTGMQAPHDLVQLAAKIIGQLSRPYAIDGHALQVTPSIGLSIFPADGTTPAELIKNADAAMYHAKNSGRNTFKFFTQDLNAKAFETLMIESSLKAAIPTDLFIEYQPQLCLRSRLPMGVEALVRWRHPTLGVIGPDKFIPIAESSGLIRDIGRWVLEQACDLIRRSGIRISVNLSPVQLAQKDIIAIIRDAVAGISPDMLTLEITESAFIHDFENAKAMLAEVRNLGICIAIDDFGTGYASLSYLRQLPIDHIKIDKSFIADSQAKSIVLAIIGLAENLGMSTIAEGVETPEQISFLERHGCNVIQGFYFSRPLDEARLLDFMGSYRMAPPVGMPERRREVEPLLTWSFTFATGIGEMDHQHQEFIRLINLLHAGDKGERAVRDLIGELSSYVKFHFDYEAGLMKRFPVASASEHLHEHGKFIRDLGVFSAAAARDPTPALAAEMAGFLGGWLSDHILATDKKLARELLAAGCEE